MKFIQCFSILFLTVFQYSAGQSVLSTGNWYKIGVVNEGIHRLTYSDLSSLGISLASIDPRNIALFGLPAGMLPVENIAYRYPDLQECAISIKGEGDGVFDLLDTVFFYGQSPTVREVDTLKRSFKHQKNYYSDTVFYFLTIKNSPGKRIQLQPGPPTYHKSVTHYDDFMWHDVDSINFIHSGKIWYGEQIGSQTPREFHFDISHIEPGDSLSIKINLAVRSLDIGARMIFHFNGDSLIRNFGNVGSSPLDPYAVSSEFEKSYPAPFSSGILIAEIDTGNAWINYIEVNVRRVLSIYQSQQIISFLDLDPPGTVSRLHFQSLNASSRVWDISNPLNVHERTIDSILVNPSYNTTSDVRHTFMIFDGIQYEVPAVLGPINNQDLHSIGGADMVIVTPPIFYNEAMTLAAHHQSFDGLTVVVAKTQEIYNEYSSGAQDPVAIRDFVRQVYKNSIVTGDTLKYLLLFGSGSYDYKGLTGTNFSLVPTWQPMNSISILQSSFDEMFYARLDDSASANQTDVVRIGVGRIPSRNSVEAAVVSKIINYATANNFGTWRNKLLSVSDDDITFLNLADTLINRIENGSCQWNIDKIYLDEFVQDNTLGYPSYPAAKSKFEDEIRQGCLMLNFFGLGGYQNWTNEKILDQSFLQNVMNDRLPLFISETIETNRFDDPDYVCNGQVLTCSNNGGGIASISTGRNSFSSSIFSFMRIFMSELFMTNGGQYNRLGDVIKIARQTYFTDPYINSICLLGDPALRLNYPVNVVSTTMINGHAPQALPDTLVPGQSISLAGQIEDPSGNLLFNFTGQIIITLYDKKSRHTTLGNDPGTPIYQFYIWDDTLATDTVNVVNGTFNALINIPWNIDSGSGIGKVSYYAMSATSDAAGCFQNFILNNLYPGIDEVEVPSVKVLTNPSSEAIRFILERPAKGHFFLKLYDLQGRLVSESVFQQSEFVLQRKHLASGLYLFELRGENNALIKRGKIEFE